ncbi:hypothetical protein Pla175_46780 [Pirellulimonas nuda]|uniref:CAP-Gly protein n=1 Tax=Pirellulimonas nuda TaxID=2528009 RepID=A0A518DIF4_9BACT|nr:hypothetical protein [Pirellulimonas nuda]QDU91258.1 hypothetical protein Pla175_46780 [Pirellulimonas nuda]
MAEPQYREEIVTNAPRPPMISWGAIIAGLFAVIAVTWLMYLLGAALGVSIADVADEAPDAESLPWMVAGWMLLTALIAYFVGSSLAARMSGVADDLDGMLHGMTLWSVATVVTLMLGYWGLSALVNTGASALSATGSAVAGAVESVGNAAASTISGAASGASSAADYLASISDTKVAARVRERLQRRAADVLAEVDPPGGTDVTQNDIREAIEGLDAKTFDRMLRQVVDEDQEGIAEVIAAETELNQDQAKELVDGAYAKLEERFGDGSGETPLLADLKSDLADRVARQVAKADPQGGADVDRQAIRDAIEDLDQQTITKAAQLLYEGKPDQVAELLAEETDLSRAQVDELVKGVRAEFDSQLRFVNQKIDSATKSVKKTVNQATEKASTYAQEALWVTFVSSAMALAVSVWGGLCGASTNRRLFYAVNRRV